jgi:hypothetical protein
LNYLASIGSDYSRPWLCIGYFNRILDQSEKFGGWPYACSSNDPFRDFLNSHGLVDLGFSGSPFTWSNHGHGRHLIRERLIVVLLPLNGFTYSLHSQFGISQLKL